MSDPTARDPDQPSPDETQLTTNLKRAGEDEVRDATASRAKVSTDEHELLGPTRLDVPGAESKTTPVERLHPSTEDSEIHVRAHVAGYEVIKELGRGGMGVVYLARQVQADRLVALKMILHSEHASKDEMQRFLNESKAIARVQHPNIVQIYEVSEHEGRPFFSLEYCSCGSLSAYLNKTSMPPEQAAKTVRSLALAMHVAHLSNIIHRDLKPSNVLLTGDGTPKITDFGLAKRLDESGQTQTGAVMGTPSYMAPEQAEGRIRDIGPVTDVYALGAILYDCLTGRPPFRSTTAMETVMQVVKHEPVAPSTFAKVPRDLETICLKCLQKEPQKRYPSALALAEDLRRFICHEPIEARPVSQVERAWKWIKRHPAVASLTGGIFLALVVLVLVLYRANAAVQKERDEALRQRESAEKQRQIAQQQSERATELLQRVFHSADQLSKVNPDRPLVIPQILGDRREQLKDAQAFYEPFLKETTDNVDVRREIARIYLRMAIIQLWLNRAEQAKAPIRQALDAMHALVKTYPKRLELQSDLTRGYLVEGHVLAKTGDRRGARDAWEMARRHAESLLKVKPQDGQWLMSLAESYLYLGKNFHLPQEQWKEAVACFERVQTIMQPVSERHPENPDYAYLIARAVSDVGIVHQLKGEHATAAAKFELCHKQLEEITKRHPEHESEYLEVIAQGYFSHGACRMKNGDATEAERAFGEAIQRYKVLARTYPNLPVFQEQLATTYFLKGATHVPEGELDQGKADYLSSIAIWKKLFEEHPTISEYKRSMANVLASQAYAIARAGDSTRALTEADKLQAEKSLSSDARFELARTYLTCAAALRRENKTAEATSREDAAVKQLTTLDFGKLVLFQPAKDPKKLRTLVPLDAIQKRPEIVSLLNRLEGK